MNAAHIHLMINHLPIVAAPLTAVLLAWGLFKRSREVQRLALGLAVIVGIATYPVFLSGEGAEERVESASWFVDEQVEEHEGQAKIALVAMLITGALAAVAIWQSRSNRPEPRTMSAIVFASLLLSSVILAWTGLTGGEIRHDEIRAGAAPPTLEERNHTDGDEQEHGER